MKFFLALKRIIRRLVIFTSPERCRSSAHHASRMISFNLESLLHLSIAFLFSIALHAQEIKPPIVYFSFDDIKPDGELTNLGTVFVETIAKEAQLIDGKFSKAISLSGTSNGIAMPLKLSDSAPYGWTLSVWIKPEKRFGSTVLFESGGGKGLRLGLHDTNCLQLSLTDARYIITTEHMLFVGRWTHVVATFDNKQARLFVNGTMTDQKPYSGTQTYGDSIILGSMETPYKAKDAKGAEIILADRFCGGIDDLKIFDYALSPNQVKELDK